MKPSCSIPVPPPSREVETTMFEKKQLPPPPPKKKRLLKFNIPDWLSWFCLCTQTSSYVYPPRHSNTCGHHHNISSETSNTINTVVRTARSSLHRIDPLHGPQIACISATKTTPQESLSQEQPPTDRLRKHVCTHPKYLPEVDKVGMVGE